MKNKYFLTLYFTLFISCVQAQKTSIGFLKGYQIYITYHQQQININAINLSSVTKIFGKPIKILKEKWEVNNAKWTRTFMYADGDLIIEDNSLAFITIKKKGWAFSFKTKKEFTGPFTIGSDASVLKNLFKNSYYKTGKGFSLAIYQCDCSLVFDTDGNKIKSAEFFTNES